MIYLTEVDLSRLSVLTISLFLTPLIISAFAWCLSRISNISRELFRKHDIIYPLHLQLFGQ